MRLGVGMLDGILDTRGSVRAAVRRRQLNSVGANPLMGVIGFDSGRLVRGSGSRMHGHLVNAPCKTTGADSKRTDFALAA